MRAAMAPGEPKDTPQPDGRDPVEDLERQFHSGEAKPTPVAGNATGIAAGDATETETDAEEEEGTQESGEGEEEEEDDEEDDDEDEASEQGGDASGEDQARAVAPGGSDQGNSDSDEQPELRSELDEYCGQRRLLGNTGRYNAMRKHLGSAGQVYVQCNVHAFR